jgi:hypothetical protein
MTTWVVAVVGGAVGTVLAALIAYAARVAAVGREVAANDLALRILDDHLETWVEDDTVRLRRELQAISETLNKENLFWSGTHGEQIAHAKERALQSYRDQERTARSHEAEIRGRESWLHNLWRAVKHNPFGLSAPERVRPILDRWAAPVGRHLSGEDELPVEIDDPRSRTIETTLEELAGDVSALT